MKTIEEVIPVTVVSGTNGKSESRSLPAGEISHVCAFYSDPSTRNAGFVRASIKDVSGNEISQMQNIANYRDREAGYLEAKKPLPINGGQTVTVSILATENFSDNFLVDFVFVYKDSANNCQI